MRKCRTIGTVGALTCAFIFTIGIFTASAIEVCWQGDPPDFDIMRLDFQSVNSGNWLVNGFVENTAGKIVMILNGNGRIVGNKFIAHLTGAGWPNETEYETFSGTLIVDLATRSATSEGIGIDADRITGDVSLEHISPEPLVPISCPNP